MTAPTTKANKPRTDTNQEEATTPASTGWGSMFADQKKRWKCPSCFDFNQQSLSKCVSCEALRPGHEGKVSANKGGGIASSSFIGPGGFFFGGVTPASGFSFGTALVPSASAPSNESRKFGGGTSCAGYMVPVRTGGGDM